MRNENPDYDVQNMFDKYLISHSINDGVTKHIYSDVLHAGAKAELLINIRVNLLLH